ncbi:MAG: pseudouridine synthase [Lachnospiraceae bacterium]|nr:pseudouridine synthase [Lachnospiraceae bacterium]
MTETANTAPHSKKTIPAVQKHPFTSTQKDIRLNKFLSEMGFCSRREADRLIEAGMVFVDGRAAVMGERVCAHQKIICNGTEVRTETSRPEPIWLVVNKPRGIVCTTSDKDRAENIIDFIGYPQRVFPVGRLDKDSQGLLLLTNEGDLVNPMMRSANAHEKEYQVRIDRPVTQEFLEAMARGVDIPELNTRTRPCQLRATGKDRFQIILTQGLNRQIRRMCETLGCNVLELKRIRIMNIHLGTLKTGSWRRMTADEYQEMLSLLNMKNN